MLELQCLCVDLDVELPSLTPFAIKTDTSTIDSNLTKAVVMSVGNVQPALHATKGDPNFEKEDVALAINKADVKKLYL